jgi:hypothetical protein
MAIRTPYDFPTENPNGEKLVSVANPVEAAPGPATYYLARRINFDVDADYTFAISADDAATVWLGTEQLNMRIIGQVVIGEPQTFTVHVPAGQYRLDVILVNLPVGQTPCVFTLTIMRGDAIVYTSAKEGWVLDDAPINDFDLPVAEDPRYKMPVWTVLPNWKDGIVERLSWQTDVLASETDAEQRRSVRRNARRSFEASFLRQRAQAQRMDAFFSGVGPATFLVPLWHEQVKMLDGISMEASGVTLPDLRFREFRKGDIVLVNNGDPDQYDLLEVGDMQDTRFSWASPPPRTWPPGTRIFPMREARIVTQNPKMSRVTDTVSTAQVLFDLVEPYQVAASWGQQNNGSPYFAWRVDRANTIDVEFSRKNFVLDNASGAVAVTDHGRYTTTTVQTSLRLYGRANAFALRQFLQAARGQAQHFYSPTFMQDIEPVDDIAANTVELEIQSQGFVRSMLRPQPNRRQLAFQFRDGTPTIYRTIIDARENRHGLTLGSETLVLDAALPAIRLDDLKRISFVCETRFGQDQFEIHHPTNGQAVIDVSVVLRQATNQRTVPA